MGTKFQFRMVKKFWEWVVVMIDTVTKQINLMPLNCIKFCAYFITIKTIEKQKIKLIFKIDAYCLDLKQYLFFIFYTSVERPCWISP